MSRLSTRETNKLGKRVTVVVPEGCEKRFGITEGFNRHRRDRRILIRPAVALEVDKFLSKASLQPQPILPFVRKQSRVKQTPDQLRPEAA